MDEYIEIKGLAAPARAFERLDGEFIDIMYTDHYTGDSVVMMLDVGFDPHNDEHILWLKKLLLEIMDELGENGFYVAPYTPMSLS